MVEVTVVRLETDPRTNHQMVWLQSVEDNDVMLPIVIGYTESMSIYSELTGERTRRPLTHDLLRTILNHFDTRVEKVRIVDLKEGIFVAELMLAYDGQHLRLDARPSDSIALALKYDAPIYVAEAVLEVAGISADAEQVEAALLERAERALSQENSGPEEALPDSDLALAVERLMAETGLADPGASPGKARNVEEQISLLEKRMGLAVQAERYEEASRIRDEIRRLGKIREKK